MTDKMGKTPDLSQTEKPQLTFSDRDPLPGLLEGHSSELFLTAAMAKVFSLSSFKPTQANYRWMLLSLMHKQLQGFVPSQTMLKFRDAVDRLGGVAEQVYETHPELVEAEHEVENTISELLEEEAVASDEGYIAALEGLPETHESLLVLLDREAKSRRTLASKCDLVDMTTFATLAAGQINPDVQNLANKFSQLRKKDAILNVEWQGKLVYPALQINRNSLTIYPEIPPLLQDAHAEGYTDWEILDWLLSEQELPSATPYVGTHIPHSSPQDLIKKVKQKAYPDEVEGTFVPLQMLQTGNVERFQQLKNHWLGD